MTERNIRDLLNDVKRMVALKLLIPDYEINLDSYVCYVVRKENGKCMYHAGKMSTYPKELQDVFVGLFLNETFGNYKITGVYKLAEYLK